MAVAGRAFITNSNNMANYLRNWNFMRGIRLILGLVILAQGIDASDYLISALGGLFAAFAIFNIGCSANAGCATFPNPMNANKNLSNEVEYEEVKSS